MDRVAPEKAVSPARPAIAPFLPEHSEMHMTQYWEKLKDPRWQRARLERMGAADFSCDRCGASDSTLNVHHKGYVKGREPWEYSEAELQVLCESCHKFTHKQMDILRRILAGATARRGANALDDAIDLLYGYFTAECSLEEFSIDGGRFSPKSLACLAGKHAYDFECAFLGSEEGLKHQHPSDFSEEDMAKARDKYCGMLK